MGISLCFRILLVLSFFCHLFAESDDVWSREDGADPLPVIYVHGLMGKAANYYQYGNWTQKYNPGQPVYYVWEDQGISGVFRSAWAQLEDLHEEIERIQKREGFRKFHLVCHSFGELLCQSYLKVYNHDCETFVSLAAVLGQFGLTGAVEEAVKKFLPMSEKAVNLTRDGAYQWLYTPALQASVPVAGFWKDPLHWEKYLAGNSFLPVVMGERELHPVGGGGEGDLESVSVRQREEVQQKFNLSWSSMRKNFLKLRHATFLSSPQDDVVEPPTSGMFEFCEKGDGSLAHLRPMGAQEYYRNDAFGLRTLDETGRLDLHSVQSVKHMEWHTREDLFVKYVLPSLHRGDFQAGSASIALPRIFAQKNN
uniref:palmitoyl-CoA hydrolase n=1 Tax=Chromera velia CCMP2878 TaxID=1169474 RepID=A0A0G4GH34_9ALVE|eukprot:Cvel_21906.t1-p1 / transcript=Cvel_21906.t1 / gene=Cvel_21906 / organism=Chromera_velia_CCMP2878 / gene_product=Lysosomal thioesterase PPT2-B, putative / transcript_product=Lysosomal thioesterase PPT2-B, putative / location=Cvel_scaffold2099:195-1289(+) / protein_length=365 / sequence_SO=supercontig / SO=protein_coding / is_pseudo=false